MKIASYNIMSGGFNSYTYEYSNPDRINEIKNVLKDIQADFIGLIDTFRWKEIYTEEDLNKLFGYKNVFHIDMEDTRVDPKIGLAILTNLDIIEASTLRLKTRNCMKSTVLYKTLKVDIFVCYFDDLSESARLEQAKVLLKNVDHTKPTIIIGDLNCVNDYEADELSQTFKNFVEVENPKFKENPSYESYFVPALNDMINPKVLPIIKSSGFSEASAAETKFTSFTKLHPANLPLIFKVDHILFNKLLSIDNYRVLSGDKYEYSSDHYPIVTDLEFKNS